MTIFSQLDLLHTLHWPKVALALFKIFQSVKNPPKATETVQDIQMVNSNAIGIKSIKNQLLLLVFIFILALLILIGFAFRGFALMQDEYSANYHNRMVPLYEVERIGALLEEARAQLLLSIQHNPASPFADDHDHPTSLHTDMVRHNIVEVERLWSSFRSRPRGQHAKELADTFELHFRDYISEGIQPTLELIDNGNYHDANAVILLYVNPLFRASAQAQAEMSNRLLEGGEEAYTNMQDQGSNLTFLLISIGLTVILASAAFAYLVIRAINRGLVTLSSFASRMSQGDLRLEGSAPKVTGEFGIIFSQFKDARQKLRMTLQQLLSTSGDLRSVSERGSVIANQARDSVLVQKQETDMVATAMNEMNATVHEVAQHAESAALSANNADKEAQKGSRVVAETVNSINLLADEIQDAAGVIQKLVEDANEIGSVVEVIGDIAEQTNLLALNAAIEAARAGEQGRGFAVVADEVRNLASRTQDSTKQINSMIEQLQSAADAASQVMKRSVKRAHEGVNKADEASQSLANITALIANMNEMNIQIASAAEEQSAVAEEMNINLSRINDAADQTADASELTAESSQDIARLSQELSDSASYFKT